MPQVDLSQLQLKARHLKLLQSLLKKHVPNAEAWAYGSRVAGDAHECSDLDLVLRHPNDLSQDLPGWFELEEALQESALPILVDVHLWSRLPMSFHQNIEEKYVVLQTRRDEPLPNTNTRNAE